MKTKTSDLLANSRVDSCVSKMKTLMAPSSLKRAALWRSVGLGRKTRLELANSELSRLGKAAFCCFICSQIIAFGNSHARAQEGLLPEFGPHSVGHRSLTIVDEDRSRSLPVDVWYPAVDNGELSKTSYRISSVVDFDFPSENAFRDARVQNTSFPLVINSHGSQLYSTSQASINESLASYGYVVVAPNHLGNTLTDNWEGTAKGAENVGADRLKDVRFTIDEVLRWNADEQNDFSGSIDPDRIGVMGLSYGGVVSIGSHLGSTSLGIEADERIKAIVPISAGIFEWIGISPAQTSATIPTLLINGTDDGSSMFSEDAFPALQTADRFLAIIDDARHLSYMDVCRRREYAAVNSAPSSVLSHFNELNDFDGGTCKNGAIDNEIAIGITQQLVVAFFETHLREDESHAKYLDPGYFVGEELPVTMVQHLDVTLDGTIDLADVNFALRRIQGRTVNIDLNFDGIDDIDDIRLILEQGLGTRLGDANLDGEVNLQDFLILSENFGLQKRGKWEAGEFNGDRVVDFADFLILSTNFGGAVGASAVPEPRGSDFYFSLLIAVLGIRSRNKNRAKRDSQNLLLTEDSENKTNVDR